MATTKEDEIAALRSEVASLKDDIKTLRKEMQDQKDKIFINVMSGVKFILNNVLSMLQNDVKIETTETTETIEKTNE